MCKFDVPGIKTKLNSTPYRDQIIDKFRLGEVQDDADVCSLVLTSMNQRSSSDPFSIPHSNEQVFKAAVLALGSNSRAWTTFLEREEEIKGLLCDYNPHCAAERSRRDPGLTCKIRKALGGYTAKRDAKAIIEWANRLSGNERYDENLRNAVCRLQCKATQEINRELTNAEIMLCLAGELAFSPTDISLQKARGMGCILASEFLRNLGWPGFKPDRHVRRLLNRWCPCVIEQQREAADRLADIVGSGRSELKEFLRFGLAGIALTPNDEDISQMDNLIWLLGAFVEEKGSETDTCYLLSVEGG